MFVRKIIDHGTSRCVVLPPAVLEAMTWEKGDHIVLYALDANRVVLTRVDPHYRPDLIAQAKADEAEANGEIPTIKA